MNGYEKVAIPYGEHGVGSDCGVSSVTICCKMLPPSGPAGTQQKVNAFPQFCHTQFFPALRFSHVEVRVKSV